MRGSEPDPVLVAFGARVRAARQSKGLSLEDMQSAGIHRSYVGQMEQGLRNPGLRNIVRLAKVLDVDPGELVVGLTNEEPLARLAIGSHTPPVEQSRRFPRRIGRIGRRGLQGDV